MLDFPPLTTLRSRLADLRGRGVYQGWPDEHQVIFIHIPKAAGTSVARALFGAASRHVPYGEYERATPDKFRRYFKFSFVRNPWDRKVSLYHYVRKTPSHPAHESLMGLTFAEFVRASAGKKPRQQSEWLYGPMEDS